MKPHQCSTCMKTFKRERDAKMHVRDSHNGTAVIKPTGPRRYDAKRVRGDDQADPQSTP